MGPREPAGSGDAGSGDVHRLASWSVPCALRWEQPGGASTGDPGCPCRDSRHGGHRSRGSSRRSGTRCARLFRARHQRQPLRPVEGGKKGTGSDTASEPTAKPTSKPSEPRKDPASTTTRQDPAVHTSPSTKPSSKDPAPKPDDPQPVAPEPIGGPDKNGEELLVRVVDVQPDVMTARVNGRRTKLYLNEPSEPGGLTYLAPLGGGCAWVGMPDTEVRFSVCKGKTERL